MLKIFADKIEAPNSLSRNWLPDNKIVDYALKHLTSDISGLTDSQILTIINTLAAIKNSITDYVKIITGKNIPVRYHSKNDSYTDGKSITISCKLDENKLNEENIDVIVGVVMHESSHIVYTDFNAMAKMFKLGDTTKTPSLINDLNKKYNVNKNEIAKTLHSIFNILEDRRIDYNTTFKYPAFMGYYKAMYYKYFNNVETTAALHSEVWKEESVESYINRILLIVNPYSDENALKGLAKIFKMIDLPRIGRLKNSEETLILSAEILDEVYKNCKLPDGSIKLKSDATFPFNPDDLDDSTIYIDSLDDIQFSDDPNAVSITDKRIVFSDKALDQLRKLMEDTERTLDGEKTPIDNSIERVNDIINSSTKAESSKIGNMNVIFTEYIDHNDISNGTYIFFNTAKQNQEVVNNGIRFGKALFKKVNILNETKIETSTRKKAGHLHKRLLHEIPSANYNIFNKIKKTTYGEYYIHITLDISTSMSGNKILECIKTTAALCTLSHMLHGKFQISVSVRYDTYTCPYVAIIYDSSKDSYNKCITALTHLTVYGSTPEGLCYYSLQNYIIKNAKGRKMYFINFSDGQPTYSYNNYSGVDHTRDMVNAMRRHNINILSYFITDADTNINNRYYLSSQSDLQNFKIMYGKDSKIIDHNSVVLVAKTLNEMFLSSIEYHRS